MSKTMVLALIAMLVFTVLPSAGAAEDIGYYEIRANVDGANVYFDGIYEGNITAGILVVPVDLAGPRYKDALLNKSGYEPFTLPLTQLPAKGQTLVLHATLRADPMYQPGVVQVLSDPTGSEILLDGSSFGTVPASGVKVITDVPTGLHTLELKLQGFETNLTMFTLKPGQILKINVVFVPVTTGTITVSSAPAGASVYLDNTYRGPTPLTIPGITVGTYQVLVRETGFNDWTGQVQVNPGQTVALDAQLEHSTPETAATTANAVPLSPLGVIFAAFCGTLLLCWKKNR